jgi:diaminobutyrate-2-oxoglutarate transaminase
MPANDPNGLPPIVPATASPGLAKVSTFERLESNVRSYARSFPVVFTRAEGSVLVDQDGKRYIDFLAGAGSLNYGHNHPLLRDCLIDYLLGNGIAHGLDLHTAAKADFLETLQSLILAPREFDYVAQFTGPTGTNAVEAALKLARKVTGRHGIIAFTNGFHGVSLGALAATGNQHHRGAAGVPLSHVYHAPFDGYLGEIDTIGLLEKLISDPSSGVDRPAAIIVETVQGEGGLNVAGGEWLRRLQQLCRREQALLIIDDIQAGCGRTGTFFSFEPAGVVPDIVTLSKSLSGFGMPLALTLIRRSIDCWAPGEHNGTFRGNNHAFVTATAALRHFWQDDAFAAGVCARGERLAAGLASIAAQHADAGLTVRGRGLMRGLVCNDGEIARNISRCAFRRGLVVETSGPRGEVVKCMPPLTTAEGMLDEAIAILATAVVEALNVKPAS